MDCNRFSLLAVYSKCYALCADVCIFVLFFSEMKSKLEILYCYPTYNGAILTLRHVEICFNFILFFSVTNCCFHIGKSMWERSRVEHGFINGRDCWMFQTLEWILSFGTWGYANFYIIVLFCFFFYADSFTSVNIFCVKIEKYIYYTVNTSDYDVVLFCFL